MAEFNPHELETKISKFGEIVEVPIYMPRYSIYHISIVATGKQGSAPGELYSPSGVAIHEDTHQIFVVDSINHRVEIFSETGEFLNQLDVEWQSIIFGIATHGDSVYVSCWGDHTVRKFSVTEMRLVWRIGGNGSDDGQLNFPGQPTTDHNGCVFIPDSGNNRICIHDPDLNHLRNITHQSISRPSDVKISNDRLYVLCPRNNPCILVLTLEGDKLHSLIHCGEGMGVLDPLFFCLDLLNNFFISDPCLTQFVSSPQKAISYTR